MAWSSSQLQYLVGGKDGTIKTYDGATWTEVSTGWSASHVYAIEWCDEYAYWLVGGKDGMIKSYTGVFWTDQTTDAVSDDVRAISIEGEG
jgi:WD40 repeat protein